MHTLNSSKKNIENIFDEDKPISHIIFSRKTGIVVSFLLVLYLLKILYIQNLSTYSNLSIFPIFVILSSFLGLLLTITSLFLFFYLSKTSVEWLILKKTFLMIFLLGFLGAYLALLMQARFLFVVLNVSFINQLLGLSDSLSWGFEIVFYTGFVPIIEEFTKIFPLLILWKNYCRIKYKEKEVRSWLVPTQRMFILYGGLFGAWFDLLEQFLVFSRNYDITNPYSSTISFLVERRTLYPLHSSLSMLVAFGIGYVFVRRNSLSDNKKRMIFLIPFTIAVLFHAWWNYNVFTKNRVLSNQSFVILGYISILLFVFMLCWLLFKKPVICAHCYSEHKKYPCQDISYTEVQQIQAKKLSAGIEKELMKCPVCNTRNFDGTVCSSCWSYPKLQCNNCNQVIPAYMNLCWACGKETTSLYDKMVMTAPPVHVTLSVVITRLLTITILTGFLLSLTDFESTISAMGSSIFYLLILVSFSITVIWYGIEKQKVKSMILSISIATIFTLTLITTGLYTIFLGVILVLANNFYTGFLGIIITGIMFCVCIKFLKASMRGARLILE